MNKRKVHDGIVGLVITLTVALGYRGLAVWFLVPGILRLVLLRSGVTGFRPLYYTLNTIPQRASTPEVIHSPRAE